MAIEGIKITLGEVSRTSQTIRSLNTQLSARLDDMKKEMDALAGAWQSDASNTIRGNFNKLTPKFEEYKRIIDSYAKFLDDTVTTYDRVETTINNNASAFQ
jgi:WXG100 family type VII secretion target